jgi:glucose/arabinose dehydrogenase
MHNTSTLRFGPDGMLYVATGDGGTASCNAAQPDEPQSLASPFGKILRLDPSAEAPYAAADNPFVDVEDADPRVLHYGLRNPFRFGMDSLTGDLYVGDVGQFSYEEVSFAPAEAQGLNFGWAAFEGVVNTCPARAQRDGSTHTEPFFVADRRRSATGPYSDYRSAMGGPVYRGSAIPELYGAALFGDFEGARMNAIFICGPAPEERSELTIIRKSCDPNYPSEACFVPSDPLDDDFVRLYSMVEGNDHEIYIVVNHDSLRKIVPNEPE